MTSQANLDKMQLRQSYRNLWHTDLMGTMRADFPFCCLALWCGPCVSYMLRKRALYNDMSRYTCCAGYLPCSGRCGESRCPEFCLCTEVFLCFGNSVASTRFLLQDEFNIQTTQCDNCIIAQGLRIIQRLVFGRADSCPAPMEEISENQISEEIPEIFGVLLTTTATPIQRKSPGTAGFDLAASQDSYIPPRGRSLISTGIGLAISWVSYGRIAARSSAAWKLGLDIGAGVIPLYRSCSSG